MRLGPRTPEGHIVEGYTAAVAIAVLVLMAGWAVQNATDPFASPYSGLAEAATGYMIGFMIVFGMALLPSLLSMAILRAADANQPIWPVLFGAAIGLLLGYLFRNVANAKGLLVPMLAGAAGGVTYSGIIHVRSRHAAGSKAGHLRPASSSQSLDNETAYLSDALSSHDPALVVLVLKEIGTLRRIPVALDENPPFGEVMRTVRELGFDLTAVPASS